MMHESSREQLGRMITGCWLTQMLYVAVKLELADHLADRPRLVSELAQQTGCHEPSLYRLLRGLASVGVFGEQTDGRFQLTDMAEYLRKGHPHSVAASVLMLGGMQYQAWGELFYSVQTGTTRRLLNFFSGKSVAGNRGYDGFSQGNQSADFSRNALMHRHFLNSHTTSVAGRTAGPVNRGTCRRQMFASSPKYSLSSA